MEQVVRVLHRFVRHLGFFGHPSRFWFRFGAMVITECESGNGGEGRTFAHESTLNLPGHLRSVTCQDLVFSPGISSSRCVGWGRPEVGKKSV